MTEFISVFIMGLIFGSFINVVIYRLNPALKLKGGVFGRSMCPKCKTQLKWHDLIPVLSFVFLKGHCRYCDKKISWQYPIVEILSGLIWAGVFYKSCFYVNFSPFGSCPEGTQLLNIFYQIFILSSLLIIAVYDLNRRIIPDRIVYPAIAIVFLYNIFDFFKFQNLETFKLLNNIETFIWPLFTASVAFLFFFSIFYFSKGRAMGFGDVKLAFLIGLFLSPLLAVSAFILAFIAGAIFGIILLWLSNKTLKSQIAFGPFLVFGVFFAFFFSNFIIKFLIF